MKKGILIFSFALSTLANGSAKSGPECFRDFCLVENFQFSKKVFTLLGKSEGKSDGERTEYCYVSSKKSNENIYSRIMTVGTNSGVQIVSVELSSFPYCTAASTTKTSYLWETKENISIGSTTENVEKAYGKVESRLVTSVERTAVFGSKLGKNDKVYKNFYEKGESGAAGIYFLKGRVIGLYVTFDE